MIENYKIKILKSSDLSQNDIDDFLSVHQSVFKRTELNRDWFKRKYIDNPYGDSYLAFAYSEDNKAAAVRSFWRNDLGKQMAFQPADTCTMPEHRRHGLFANLTKAILNLIPKSALIYNFPNSNSLPQYLKLGWRIHSQPHIRFYSKNAYFQENPYPIDDIYLSWWILPTTQKSLYICRRDEHVFLVYPSGSFKRYCILGEISEEKSKSFNNCHPIILTYPSQYYTWYNRNRHLAGSIAVYNVIDEIYVPLWKLDYI